MMRYPDKNELLAYLEETYGRLLEDWRDAAEAAIYWFAYDWHGSLCCPLYEALCTSPYRPGPCMTLAKEDAAVREMHAALAAHFEDGLPYCEELDR